MRVQWFAGLIALLLFATGAAPQDVDRLPALLDKAERLGMTVPDLSRACLEMQAIADAGGSRVKPDWTNRLQVLQSRAAVAEALHRHFKDAVGKVLEVLPKGGRKDNAKIVDVRKNEVEFQQGSVKMTVAFSDLDTEWTVTTVERLLPKEDAESVALHLGLFLASSARWEAAGRFFARHPSRHPLAVEARQRGQERVFAGIEKAIASKKWTAAFDLLKQAEALDPDGEGAAKAKRSVRDALFSHARDCAVRKAKSDMNAAIALIEKHFPEEKDLPALIRDEVRWTALDDPKLFELTGKIGAPFVLSDDPSDAYSRSAYCQKDFGPCDGLAARMSAMKAPAGVPGLAWDSGRVNLWIDLGEPTICLGSMTAERTIQLDWSSPVDRADIYDVAVVIEKGEYVVRCNGKEAGRHKAKIAALGNFCIKVSKGDATFEKVRIRRKS